MTPNPLVERDPLPQIEARLEGDRLLFLFLDYDGTLVPIRALPEDAVPDSRLLEALSRLAACAALEVAILSGRSLEEISRLLPVEGIFLAGGHGAQIRGPAGYHRDLADREEFRRQVEAFRVEAEDRVGEVEGAFLEDKGFALAVHTRLAARPGADALVSDLEAMKDHLLDPTKIDGIRGKEVWELRPKGVHKGAAAMALLDDRGGDDPFPVAIGDDRTDQDSFAVVRDRGISVLVGEGWEGARADGRLPGPPEVVDLLERIGEWSRRR